MKARAVKDKRVGAKRAAQDLGSTIEKALTGELTGRPGAEAAGLEAVKWLVQLYLFGEGPLPEALRKLVAELQKPQDPLRRDMPMEAWSALWPVLNTLTHARQQAAARVQAMKAATTPEESHERKEEGRPTEGSAEGQHPGPGPVGAGVARSAGEAGAGEAIEGSR